MEEGTSRTMIDEDQVEESIEYFASTRKIEKCDLTLEHLENLEVVADNGGWEEDKLATLFKCAQQSSWPAQLLRRFLSCLVPASTLPGSSLASLCTWAMSSRQSRDCITLPTLRLATLCLQYDCVTERFCMVALYELFLSLLGRDKLTPAVAEILLFLTSKAEVTVWRVATVQRVRTITPHAALDSLVARFRQLRPDLVPQHTAPQAKSAKQGSTSLHKRFHKVWEDRVDLRRSTLETSGIWSSGQLAITIQAHKKSTLKSLLPSGAPLSLRTGMEAQREGRSQVALTECTSLVQVTDNLHRVQLPAQILSLLGCRVGVNILVTEEALVERLSLTLYHTLHNEFLGGEKETPKRIARQRHLLTLLVNLQRSVQQGIPVVGRFLTEYLAIWDGARHFTAVMALVSQVQITDFQEVKDCLLDQLHLHLKEYSVEEQMVVLDSLAKLSRAWAAVEHHRFNSLDQGESQSVFPINSQHCTSSLESIIELSAHISEFAMTSLNAAQEKHEDTSLLVADVFNLFQINQQCLLHHKVPVRLEVPKCFFTAALVSYDASLIEQACAYIVFNRNTVIPFLRAEKKAAIQKSDLITSELVASQLTEKQLAPLNEVGRDYLVFLAPGRTEVKKGSLLKEVWAAGKEEWIRDHLFISSHPAFLPAGLKYIGEQHFDSEEIPKAWQRLKEEDNNATMSSLSLGVTMAGFLEVALEKHPGIKEFLAAFTPKERARARWEKEDCGRSVSSQATAQTGDSGIFSAAQKQPGKRNSQGVPLPLPVPKRKSRESGEPGWGGKSVERGRQVEGNKGKEVGLRMERSARGGRLVERALKERN